LKGLFQPKAITAAMIKISTNSRRRFMSKIVRKNDQSNPLRKVGECLYRNGHSVYFAWFSVRGKQVKRSLKTNEKELARRRQSLFDSFSCEGVVSGYSAGQAARYAMNRIGYLGRDGRQLDPQIILDLEAAIERTQQTVPA
jgi:hypothetical protein